VDVFFERLKRRKLAQWALAYAAAAFALLQGADIIAQRFGWPESIERGLIVALAVGLLVTIVLAWYHGDRGAQRVTGTELLILALLLAVGGGLLWWVAGVPPTVAATDTAKPLTMPSAPIPNKSIAVLPLTNESGEKDQQYFSDGLSEDLITALSQFAGLKVIGRNSSFQFRDTKLPSASLGQALGVAHLLEGSVRRAGDVVRISAMLVNAADGSTLWSQRYDRPYKDLFALQDDITRSVADALKAKLLDGGGAVVQSERPPSGNLEAWNAWSRGRVHDAMINAADERTAIGFYEQAIALDPRYARAYASVALTWTTLAGTFLSGEEQRQAYVKARAAADEALRLDPNVATAHAARGLLLQWVDFDLTGAQAEFQRAVELAPADSLSHFTLARMSGTLGRAREAIPMLRQVITIDPRSGTAWGWLGWHLAAVGQFEEAEQAARQAVALVPNSPFIAAGLVIIQIQRGETDAALTSAQQIPPDIWRDIALAFAAQGGDDRAAAGAALKRLIDTSADGSAYQIAEVYALRKDPDDMFEWLDRAWAIHDSGISRLLTDPFILRYRDDPRFAAFCKTVGLPATTDAKAMP
jgi:TolB-like protein/tetratricopeptide (TPR) repeat protein